MTVPRLFAIALVFLGATAAWLALATSVVVRTGESDARLAHEVEDLWGGRHNQSAPDAWFEQTRVVVERRPDGGQPRDAAPGTETVTRTVVDRIPVPLVSSTVEVALALDQRQKGLLWYDTYAVSFAGRYRLINPDAAPQTVFLRFRFPSAKGLYDAFALRVNGHEAGDVNDLSQGITAATRLDPGGEATLEVSYRSRGLGDWTYSFAPEGVAQVRDFEMRVTTDCDGVDFPAGSLSPSRKTRAGGGWSLDWAFKNLVTGQRIGVDLPNRLNPGPLAARITFFAPICLLFFITVVVVIGVLRGDSLHPMHYLFLSAAFFAFHLLLAYLVDQISIHAAFAVAAITSITLVVTYLRLVRGTRFAFLQAGLAQLVFLVLFSYSFFFEGYTGLTVTIGAVVTLFVLMQTTARVDWSEVFSYRPGASVARTAQ